MSSNDRAYNAIDALLADVRAAWAANDAETFAQAFSEDAIFIPFNGARLVGRTAIAKFHAPPFATEFHGSRLLINLIDIRPLAETFYLVATSGGPTRPDQIPLRECRAISVRTSATDGLSRSFRTRPFSRFPAPPDYFRARRLLGAIGPRSWSRLAGLMIKRPTATRYLRQHP
jgi:uncharacterized protein (TIGR02246 family)